ncbi:MAG: tRNA (adenosine(37)-N6)-dimethylallyltransferase MiaA [Alphaproteobacteria bacterium]|nr:tRNA (adenosine(37)-N6)-dimethylallyltransferase MiaA [Alphaproteobacteria bacterium]
MNNKKAYIITGPTASGKSGFAHALAVRIGGVIINCDSVQIYRNIENISASPFANRPITDEIDGVPYRLFSVLPLSEQISVAEYIKMAHQEYEAAIAMGRIPIFVGGTGYYINGIINGIAEIPEISHENRMRAREMVANDLDMARRLVPNCTATDPQRIARAIEVFLETGRHLNEWQNSARMGAIEPTPFRILINPPLDVLHKRIASRIPEMISGGAINEAQYIIENNLDSRRAIGAEQLCAFLRGDINQDAAIENWITKTNQYAKRQRTWFRTQFSADFTIDHIPNDNDLDAVTYGILS